MLCGMTNPTDFLAAAFQTIRDFLRETSQLDMPVRALARQVRARLIMARTLLRRVSSCHKEVRFFPIRDIAAEPLAV